MPTTATRTPSQTPAAKAARAARAKSATPATDVQAKQAAAVLNGVTTKAPTGRTSRRNPAPVTTTQKAGTKAPAKATKAAKAPAKAAAKATTPAEDGRMKAREAKRELATFVIESVAAALENATDPSMLNDVGGRSEAARLVSLWLHHLPADRERWVKVLPAPDRSDWR